MQPHTRALIAAATYAFVTGKRVAGLYDHTAKRDRRIAAEARGPRLQGHDGDRAATFSGTLPEIRDATAGTVLSFTIEGTKARAYNRTTATFCTAEVTGGVVQVFDHAENAWFAYDVQDADAPQSYVRKDEVGD